jgi:phage shock protein PspC (stress-responsive transcriptional regulator)
MTAQPSSPPRPPLERLRDDRWVAGVCSGVARTLGIDTTIVRVAAVLLMIFGGLGIAAYLVAVLLVPEEGEQEPLLRRALDGEQRPLAIALAVLTVIALFSIDPWPFDHGHFFFPLIIGASVVGIFAIARSHGDTGGSSGSGSVATAPGDTEATTVVDPIVGVGGQDVPPAATAPDRHKGASLIAAGVALAVAAAVGAVLAFTGDDVRWDVFLAGGVIALGVVLIVAAPFGGARLLIPLGLMLAAVVGVAAAADLDLKGGVGERLRSPATVADLKPAYHLTAGRLVLDLRDTELPAGDVNVKANVGFGELIVRVPRAAEVDVHAHVAAGDMRLFGHEDNGMDVDADTRRRGGVLDPRVHLNLRVGFGSVRVIRADQAVPSGSWHRDRAALPAVSAAIGGGWR